VFLAIVMILAQLACSLGATTAPTATVAPTDKPEPTQEQVQPTKAVKVDEPTKEAAAPAAKGMVTTLADVQKATIQIEADGTFVDPEVGVVVNGAGRGSGFIIDPSGIAVTNNHVVTGAALLKVWVGGDTSKTYNAKVLGASECSDLAVIQLEGDNFPFLGWHEGDPAVGLDVYAAGYPLGDPQYTLTKGIVSKAKADGKTSWASISNVLEHDARINPGNSGGPLVDKDGKVVGVNYASNQANQYFAITRSEVDSVAKQLRSGFDVTSIGVNGQAVSGTAADGTEIAGIWVSSVKAGSAADKALIKPGDIITQLSGLVLATDGTMGDYCSILRSHKPTDTLDVSVLRWSTQELLTGQLNGRTLEVAYSFFENQLSGQTDNGSGTNYSEWTTITDDTDSITVEVPSEWTDTDTSEWSNTWTLGDGRKFDFTAASIMASTDLTGYNDGFSVPGMTFAASNDWGQIGGYANLLEGVMGWYENDCTYDKRYDYNDSVYEGGYDFWKNCGADDTGVVVLALRPISNKTAFLILIEVRITSDADLNALDHIFSTFEVK
jgi:serine protease Do